MNCVLFVTHCFNSFIRSQYDKLVKEVDDSNYDIWILYNGDVSDLDYPNMFVFNEATVRSQGYELHNYYQDGGQIFYGNNFELSFISFFDKHQEYDKYWLVEYDVFCNGNWNDMFSYYDKKRKDVDFYATHIGHRTVNNATWPWWDKCWNINFEITNKIKSFNPICRFSNIALSKLNEYYKIGNYGFYETFMPTIFYNEGMKIRAFDYHGDSDKEFIDDWSDNHNEWIEERNMKPWPLTITSMQNNKIYHAIKCNLDVAMEKAKTARILVCCHKDDIKAIQEPYFPIHVGKALSSVELDMPGDNTGDNISDKNRSYCELTGIYWAWKNWKNVDVVGLCHYRRYFDFYHQGKKILPYSHFSTSSFGNINLDVPEKVLSQICPGTIAVAKKLTYGHNVFTEYCVNHISDDIRVLQQYFRENLSKEDCQAFDKVMIGGNKLYLYNMFIMSWSDFDKYCKWLFPIIDAMSNRIDSSHYSNYQKRVLGFLSERLLNVYICKERLKVKEYPVILFEGENESASDFNYCCRRICYALSFFFSNLLHKYWLYKNRGNY